ncbi:MAG: hypothetical protein AB7V48_02660 [Sedimentibacter sp.]
MNFLSRLVDRGFLEITKQGRFNYYNPLICEDEYLQKENTIEGQLSGIKPDELTIAGSGYKEALLLIYFVGLIIYLTYELFSYFVFRQNILRWSRKPSNNEIKAILIDVKQRLR